MAPQLTDYLARARAMRWEWGNVDCCTFAADWVREVTGRDPMQPLRGRYHTRAMAEEMVAAAGGLETLLRRAEAQIGRLPNACVIRFDSGTEAAGLYSGEWLWHMTPRGVQGLNRNMLKLRTVLF